MITGASDESVRLTLNTVEKRLALFKQELETSTGLKRGVVVTYNGTTRSGTATIDNKEYQFKAVNATIAVGDTGVFQRLTNSDRGYIMLGVIL
jgi:hypothetical protein